MKITKDEARIIAIALQEYSFSNDAKIYDSFDVINKIRIKAEKFQNDKRRNGRMSMDTLFDVFKRLKSLL
jgi:hypothetical protein